MPQKYKKPQKDKVQKLSNLINNALASLNMAHALLKELEEDKHTSGHGGNQAPELEGVVGKFVGDAMVTGDGKRFELPHNYIAKTGLVFGDTIKMVEVEGVNKFKQIGRVKREKVDGILAKKEGKWHVVTADGSHRLLNSAVDHHQGAEGDMVTVIIPSEQKFAPFACLDHIHGKPRVHTKPVEVLSPAPVESTASVEVTPALEPEVIPVVPVAPVETIASMVESTVVEEPVVMPEPISDLVTEGEVVLDVNPTPKVSAGATANEILITPPSEQPEQIIIENSNPTPKSAPKIAPNAPVPAEPVKKPVVAQTPTVSSASKPVAAKPQVSRNAPKPQGSATTTTPARKPAAANSGGAKPQVSSASRPPFKPKAPEPEVVEVSDAKVPDPSRILEDDDLR